VKTLYITRKPSTDQGTPGYFSFGSRVLRCIELPWRDNAPGRSCIPPGTYRAELYASPKHGTVYMLQDVPGRSDVEIHAANFAGDSDLDWKCELLGCIAPAESIGTMENTAEGQHKGQEQLAGISSRAALAEFMTWAGGEPIEITIT
jgi:hypothetical protein